MSLMDLFKKKPARQAPAASPLAGQSAGQTDEPRQDAPAAAAAPASREPSPAAPAMPDMAQMQALANELYPGIALFARDLDLDPALAARYEKGMLLRERAFTDCSSRFMGMAASHRYVILSNHLRDFSPFEQGTNWGLHVAARDAHFKVLGTDSYQGKTGIFLLHLPDDERWKLFRGIEFSMDEQLFQMAVQRFRAKCLLPPVPELDTPQWRDRCAFPIGMDDAGQLWPLE